MSLKCERCFSNATPINNYSEYKKKNQIGKTKLRALKNRGTILASLFRLDSLKSLKNMLKMDCDKPPSVENKRKRTASSVQDGSTKKQKLTNVRKVGVPVNRLGSYLQLVVHVLMFIFLQNIAPERKLVEDLQSHRRTTQAPNSFQSEDKAS